MKQEFYWCPNCIALAVSDTDAGLSQCNNCGLFMLSEEVLKKDPYWGVRENQADPLGYDLEFDTETTSEIQIPESDLTLRDEPIILLPCGHIGLASLSYCPRCYVESLEDHNSL